MVEALEDQAIQPHNAYKIALAGFKLTVLSAPAQPNFYSDGARISTKVKSMLGAPFNKITRVHSSHFRIGAPLIVVGDPLLENRKTRGIFLYPEKRK